MTNNSDWGSFDNRRSINDVMNRERVVKKVMFDDDVVGDQAKMIMHEKWAWKRVIL